MVPASKGALFNIQCHYCYIVLNCYLNYVLILLLINILYTILYILLTKGKPLVELYVVKEGCYWAVLIYIISALSCYSECFTFRTRETNGPDWNLFLIHVCYIINTVNNIIYN